MKAAKYSLVIGFAFIILFPLINNKIHFFSKLGSSENRRMTQWPVFKWSVDDYIKGVEGYLIDNLDIRNNAIRFHNRLSVFVFRSSPSPVKALVGKNGWLFMSGEELKTFAGTELFTEAQLNEFKQEIIRRQKVIGSYNAKLLMAIVPNKANVYPEFMPDHLIKNERYGYGEQMTRYLKANGFPVIDLYSILTQNKSGYDIYYRTDDHWNNLGAFIAANSIMEEMHSFYPKIAPLDTIKFPIKKIEKKDGSIALMLNIEKEAVDHNYSPTPKEGFKSVLQKEKRYTVIKEFPFPKEYEQVYYKGDTALPNVLIIRDSYGKALVPYLAEQCNKCVAIWDCWRYGLNEEIIKDSKPDIVIYLICESQLKNLMKHTKK